MTQDECSCHMHPPCSFCESLTEEEAEAFADGGADAVHGLRARLEHGEECRCDGCCDRRAGAADQARDAENDA